MPVTNEDLVFKVVVDAKGAVKGIEAVTEGLEDLDEETKDTQKGMKGLSTSFSAAASTAIVLNQGLELASKAMNALIGPIKEANELFGIQEKAELKVANALALTTGFTQQALDGWKAYASQLQENSVVGDETTLSLISLAKAAGVTDEVTKKLIQSSADLAAGTDKDLRTSFEALLSSLKGEAGELAKYDKSLLNLSKTALQSGKAIDVIGQRFANFAKREAQTFSGAIIQAQNAMGDLFEEIGKTIEQVFNLTQFFRREKDVINGFIETVAEFRPVLVELRKGFVEFARAVFRAIEDMVEGVNDILEELGFDVAAQEFMSFKEIIKSGVMEVTNAFRAIAAALNVIDFRGLIAESQALFASLALFASPAILKALTGIGVAIAAAVAPILLATAKMLLLGAAIVTVGASIDIINRNFENLAKVLEGAFTKSLAKVQNAFLVWKFDILNTIRELLNSFADAASSVSDDIAAKIREDAIDIRTELFKTQDQIVENTEKIKQSQKEIFEGVAAIDLGFIGKAYQEGEKFITKFNEELGNTTELTKELSEQEKLLQKIREEGSRGGGNQGPVVDKAIVAALQAAQLETLGLQTQLENIGKSTEEQIRNNLELDMARIDAKKEQLRLQGQLTGALDAELEKQKQILSATAEANISEAKNPQLVTPDQLNNISDTFGDATAGLVGGIGEAVAGFSNPVSGMMQAAKAIVGAIQAMIDFIPQMLDAITKIFTSLTELPQKITESINGLFEGVAKFISDFIPNLIDGITERLLQFVEFFAETLPDAFASLAEKIPEAILNLVDKLPEIFEKLGASLVKTGPLLALQFSIAIIKAIPKIVVAFVKAIPKIVEGFVNGFIEALKEAINAVTSALGLGEFFNIDTDGLKDAVEDIADTLTKATEDVFAVIDLEAAARGFDQAKRIGDAILDSTRKAVSWLQRMWDKLVEIWRWVWKQFDKWIIQPLRKAWLWIWENVITPLLDGLWAVWMWTREKILEPLAEFVMKAWQWVVDNVYKPLGALVQQAWQWVVDKILQPLAGVVQAAFDAVFRLFDSMADIVRQAFGWLSGMFETAKNAFTGAFSWIKKHVFDAFGQGIMGTFSWINNHIFVPFQSALRSIANIFKKAFDSIRNVFNKLADALNSFNPGSFGGGGGSGGGIISSRVGGTAGAVAGSIGLADGGPVPGFAMADNRSIRVRGGEFVLTPEGRSMLGDDLLNAANAGRGRGTASSINNSEQQFNINVTVNNAQNMDPRMLAEQVKRSIKDDSLQGRFVLNTSGLRT